MGNKRFNVHNGAVLGDNVSIGDYVTVYAGAYIGDNCMIEGLTQIWSGVRLANNVRLGPGVNFEYPSKSLNKEESSFSIDENCDIGANAVIMHGVTIGIGARVLPGTIINQDVPPYSIVEGSPARVTGYVENDSLAVNIGLELQSLPEFSSEQNVINIGVGAVTLHKFKMVRDLRGDLSVGEFSRDIPFEPKRYFMVFNVPSEETRGEHAHRKCHQFLICVKGSCSVVVDDGVARREVKLDSLDMGIYLPPMIWGIQYKYSSDAVLMVFTSEYYDDLDYIRDYNQFIALVNDR